MKKSYYLAVAILGLLLTTGAVSLVSLAATDETGMAQPKMAGTPPPNRGENQPATQQAIINGDYDTWATAMQEEVTALRQRADEMEGKISQGTFAKLQEAHKLMQSGDTSGAKAIFEELGMFGPFHGKSKGFEGEGRGLRPDQKPPCEQQSSEETNS